MPPIWLKTEASATERRPAKGSAWPVTPAMVSQWKQEGFKAVAVVLDERTGEAALMVW